MTKASVITATLFFVIFSVIGPAFAQTTGGGSEEEPQVPITLDEFGFADESLFKYSSQGSDWSTLFPTCIGTQQSPIDITSVTGTCDASMVFNLQLASGLNFTYNVTTYIQAEGNFGQLYATDVNGNLAGYKATLFKLHAPSEHTVSGQSYDAELQFYFDLMDSFTPVANRTRAVVSFFLTSNSNTTSNESSVLTPLTLGNETTEVTNISFTSLVNAIPLSDSGTVVYYTYQGSLTAPPCDETVNYYVIGSALPISEYDLTYLNSLWIANGTFAGGQGNNRAVQPLNSRTIKQGGVACEEQFVYFFSFFILYIIINYFIFKLL